MSDKVKAGRFVKPGRRKLPRADVWDQLKQLNYDPIIELVNNGSDPVLLETIPGRKLKADIDKELLSYCASKARAEITLDVAENPLTDMLKKIALQGRPQPEPEPDEDDQNDSE